jgi:putative copper resistance protein D
MVTDTVTTGNASRTGTGTAAGWAPSRRVLLGGVATVLATIVVLAVTAPDTAVTVRTADVLGLDLGWAPWLVPVTNTAATLSAVTVVGLLLSAGFLSGRRTASVVVAALGWTAVTAVRVCAGAAEVYGIPVRRALRPRALWYFVTEVPVGQALLASFVLTVVVAVGCRVVRSADGAAVLTVLAILAVLPPVSTGHASTAGNHQVIASAIMLHAASAVVWTGGLVALVLGGRPSGEVGAASVRRFSRIASWCFAITVATGVVGSAARLERWSDLTSTRYGTVLAIKGGALVTLGVFGWWHRRRSLPALAAGRPRVFLRVAGVELLVLAATMGLAVALSRTAPPNEVGTIVFDAPLTPALRWIPEPVLLLLAAVAVTAYLAGVRRTAGWSRTRTAAWVSGWSLMVAAGTVQFATVDPSETVTVLQPLLAALVVPPLLVAGAPAGLARAAGVERLAGIPSPPLLRGLAVVVYMAAGYGLLVAVADDWATTRHGVHLLVYLAVVAAGCLVWSPAGRPPAPEIVVVRVDTAPTTPGHA